VTTTHGSHVSSRFVLRERGLPDLDTAIDWLREHWDGQRTAPTRLTQNDTEGELGGLRYSGAFSATLGWNSRTSVRTQTTIRCGHPLAFGRAEDCGECFGAGIKDVLVDRYPHPMSTALVELSRRTTLPGQIPALAIIYALASANFRLRVAMRVLGLTDEGPVLGAIRQLFGKYQAGPVATTSWVDKSQSQQAAESAA